MYDFDKQTKRSSKRSTLIRQHSGCSLTYHDTRNRDDKEKTEPVLGPLGTHKVEVSRFPAFELPTLQTRNSDADNSSTRRDSRHCHRPETGDGRSSWSVSDVRVGGEV
jgi:hypothetical protein